MVDYKADMGDIWARKPQNSTVVKDTGPPSALSRALKGKPSSLQIPRLKIQGHLVVALEQVGVLGRPFSFLYLLSLTFRCPSLGRVE